MPSMATDPLAPEELAEVGPVPHLDSATIQAIVYHYYHKCPTSEQETQETKVALIRCFKASFLPGLITIAELAGMPDEDELCNNGLFNAFLRVVDDTARSAFKPPYSREYIYEFILTDWLVETVACDRF